jgi:uncharacterized repeat protein (TIGR03803 family)
MAKNLVSFPAVLLAAMLRLFPFPDIAQSADYETLYSFKGSPDGAAPIGGLFVGQEGVLYGTTEVGGTSKYGTIFAMIPSATAPWKEYVLHNFTGSPDGAYPQGGLAYSTTAGVFYGTTVDGGGGSGAVYQLAPPSTHGGAWTETVLYGVPSSRNSQNQYPIGNVFIDAEGTLFFATQGTINSSDSVIMGTVDALAPPTTSGGAWTPYVLYALGNGGLVGGPSGDWPFAGVVGYEGSLFGTTSYGGDLNCGQFGCGTVYELTPPEAAGGVWTETTVYQFTGPDGSYPAAGLTVGPDGVLYGTTSFGGTGSCSSYGEFFGCGTVFQLTPPSSPDGTWTLSVLYSFTSLNGDGAYPLAVVVGKNGTLYGTTESGGNFVATCPQPVGRAPAGCGTVFELVPPTTPGGPWTENVLHVFAGAPGDGSVPTAGLALSPSGILFGTTYSGGANGAGTVFAVAP